jgi:hypothetical protein
MPGRGYISLRRIAERINVLVITCAQCRRRDPYSLWKLIAKYGPEASIERLQQDIIADCPHKADPMIAPGTGCVPVCSELPNLT